jgi:hypothetical protein
VPYGNYVKILKYLTLSLFAYVATAIIVGGNLEQILAYIIFPHIEFNSNFAMMFVAIVGTTIFLLIYSSGKHQRKQRKTLLKKDKGDWQG